MVKLKEQDVVNRLKSIVGDTLDFSKGLPYKGTLFKFQAICKVCGNCFTTNVANIFSGRGCKKCADKRATLSNTDFIAKCESLYLQKFDYSFVNYEGGREPVKIICKELGKPESLITHVTDRKGHDMRYAIDPTKIETELGWKPKYNFDTGIEQTIQWYLDNQDWWKTIISGEYQNYYEKMYGNR